MISNPQYRKVPGSDTFYFYINSKNLEDDINWINRNGIKNIRLSEYDGYSLKSIAPVLKIKEIKKLVIFIKDADLSALAELHDLEELSIGESGNQNIDFSNFQELKDLYFVYNKDFKYFNSLTSLLKLTLVNADESILNTESFQFLKNLIDITFLSCKIPNSLFFLSSLNKVQSIEFFNTKASFDISELKTLKDTLNNLRIDRCKKIVNLQPTLSELYKLKFFALVDSVTLSNCDFVYNLKELQYLIVLGSSFFINGNLTALLNTNMEIRIDNKKHYNVKAEEFETKKKIDIR